MHAYIQSETEDTIRLGLKEYSTTLVDPLIYELNKDENVVYARYAAEHPELVPPIVEVKVSKGSPRDALKKASEKISDYFSEIIETE